MPSTTSNYGWTYPISSDDLNAGATTVGTLATGIDTSLASEASTRSSAISSINSSISTINANKPNSNVATLNVKNAAITTDSLGVYYASPAMKGIIYANGSSGGSCVAVKGLGDRWLFFKLSARTIDGSAGWCLVPNASDTVTINYVEVP